MLKKIPVKIIALFLIAFALLPDMCLAAPKISAKFTDEKASYFDVESSKRRQTVSEEEVDQESLLEEMSDSEMILQAVSDPNSPAIHQWFLQNQAANPSGLVASHPQDPSFIYHEGNPAEWARIEAKTQAYTYNQAVGGIIMLKEKKLEAARKIFNFYYSQWENDPSFQGFWSVYNIDPAYQWKRYEWRKEAGANAWMAIFALHYSAATRNANEKQKAKNLATGIGNALRAFPRHEGAVAMAPDNANSSPNYGKLYSTEHNFVIRSAFKALSTKAKTAQERALFKKEYTAVHAWLKTKAYNPASGLFSRGGKINSANVFEWDTVASSEVQAWALVAVGPNSLKKDFQIDPNIFARKVLSVFAIQADGSFGGDPLTAKGFDYSDSSNAQKIGRQAIKSVEKTNELIVAFRLLANYYKNSSRVNARFYNQLVSHFTAENAAQAVHENGSTGYLASTVPDTQIYYGTGNWKTPYGMTAASTGWVYFALRNINPFIV